MEVASPVRADVVALDRGEQPILFVAVKARPADHEIVDYLALSLRTANTTIPFAMLVDSENIRIFHWDGKNLSESLCSLKTADVLRHYDPDFDSQQTFAYYLEGLVEAWLRDLAYHWKSETPPASEELAAIGLLPRLKEGTTWHEVEVIGDALRLRRD